MDHNFSQLHQQVAALTLANETLQKDKNDLKTKLQATKTENEALKEELEALRAESSNTASKKRNASELDTSNLDKATKKPVHTTNKNSTVAAKIPVKGKSSFSQSSLSRRTSTNKVPESKSKLPSKGGHSSSQPPKGGTS